MYSFSVRYYLFDGNSIKKVTIKRLDDFYIRGKSSFPEYAGQSIKIAAVTVSLFDGKPIRALFVRGLILKVRKDGGLDKRHKRKLEELSNKSLPEPDHEPENSIINASEIFRQKRIFSQYFWKLSEKHDLMLLDEMQL